MTSKLTALLMFLSATAAGAQGLRFSTEGAGPYFRTELGPNFTQDGRLTKFGSSTRNNVEFDTGFTFDAAVGYAFNKYLAADFEFGYIGTTIDSVSGYFVNDDTFLYNAPFLANVTFSYPIPRTIITPYIGAGVGGSVTVFDTDGFGNSSDAVFGSDTDVVFAWQAFAGLRFELNKQISMGVGYKYFSTEGSSFSYPPLFPGTGPDFHVGFDGVRSHSVLFAFQMKF
jgi:opacity protein-like surface antigen